MEIGFVSDVQHQSKRQWAQTSTQEAPSEHQAALLGCVGNRALAQTAQRLWSLHLRDHPKPPGYGPGHPALRDLAEGEGL